MAWGGRSTSPEGGKAPEVGLGPGLRQRQRIRRLGWVGGDDGPGVGRDDGDGDDGDWRLDGNEPSGEQRCALCATGAGGVASPAASLRAVACPGLAVGLRWTAALAALLRAASHCGQGCRHRGRREDDEICQKPAGAQLLAGHRARNGATLW